MEHIYKMTQSFFYMAPNKCLQVKETHVPNDRFNQVINAGKMSIDIMINQARETNL